MLIFQAIVEAPNQQLNLCDIYAWFQANFLHFRSSNLTWKVKIKNIHTHTHKQTDISTFVAQEQDGLRIKKNKDLRFCSGYLKKLSYSVQSISFSFILVCQSLQFLKQKRFCFSVTCKSLIYKETFILKHFRNKFLSPTL